jgi:hypothetical protein
MAEGQERGARLVAGHSELVDQGAEERVVATEEVVVVRRQPVGDRLEKWLRSVIRAREIPGRGKGSHRRWELPDGTPIGFATSAGFLLPPEAKEIAAALGLSKNELFEHISAMREPAVVA